MRLNQDYNSEKQTKIYLFSYEYDNAIWSVEIPTYSKEDAEQRIEVIANAKYDGKLQMTVHIPSDN